MNFSENLSKRLNQGIYIKITKNNKLQNCEKYNWISLTFFCFSSSVFKNTQSKAKYEYLGFENVLLSMNFFVPFVVKILALPAFISIL